MSRDVRSGVILINVLVVLALASIVLLAMLRLGDASLVRSQRFGEAGAAIALLQAGEQSAIAALRRDMVEAGDIDHVSEAWAAVGQAPVAIAGGAFSLEIADAQDRFNLNRLTEASAADSQMLRAAVAMSGLPPEVADGVLAALDEGDPLEAPDDLIRRGVLGADELEALRPFVTALPGSAEINVNAAPADVLEALLGNRIQARLVAAIRDQKRGVTAEDLETVGIFAPEGVGFGSSLFLLRVTARIGDIVQHSESLLQRRESEAGTPEVVVIRRQAVPVGRRSSLESNEG